jgi:competence protein ComEA
MFTRLLTFTLLSAFITFPAAAETIDKPVVATASPAVTQKVNLNTADETMLTHALKSVTPRRAKAIISYRTQHGPFKKLEDLALVKGVGKAYVKKNLLQIQQVFTVENKSVA